ncbi:uncharacterized protein LOC126828621 [Patella vulgata]|uniref:uncharacterized protein LOC126828621 n=1 Tax=Patella vulgata TaxID=6465 RepID=UPI00217F58DE|nr:uncharacterized protein LOC126828621 [Patella vulgata]
MAHYTPRYNTCYYDHQARRDVSPIPYVANDKFGKYDKYAQQQELWSPRGSPRGSPRNVRAEAGSRLDRNTSPPLYREQHNSLSRLENYEDNQTQEPPLSYRSRYGDQYGFRYPEQPLDTHRYEYKPKVEYSWDRPSYKPLDQGAYLFVRFPTRGGSNINVVAQSCVLNKRSAEVQGGRFLGIARKIHEHGTPSTHDEALVVYIFNKPEAARLFFISDKRFKQPDFPPPAGHCEAWSVCRYYSPDRQEAYSTFMMSEVRLLNGVNHTQYKDEFCSKFAQLLLDYNAHPFVIQANTIVYLRRHFTSADTIVTLHLFTSPRQLEDVMADDRYLQLKRIHSELASEICTVFTIDPILCP